MKKLKTFFTIKSHWLILLMTLYFGTVLNLKFWEYVYNNIEINSFATVCFAGSLVFFVMVPLYLIFNLIVVPYLDKTLFILLLLISSATNYMMYHLGVIIDEGMIRSVMETNVREATDLISLGLIVWVAFTGILPALLIWFTKIQYSSWGKELRKRLGFAVVCLLVVLGLAAGLYKQYATFGRNYNSARKVINTTYYLYSTIKYFKDISKQNKQFVILDNNATFEPYNDSRVTVLVLVVGEAARAKNFSLYGYERKTNPLLEKQDIIHFQKTTSCGTMTTVSVPCMFSHEARSDFNLGEAKYTQNLLDLLEMAGYDIVWFENDDGCKGVCKRVLTIDMVQTQNPKYCKSDYCRDDALLDGLEERIKNIKKNTLIVLHTMGSHGPTYYNRYPEKFKVFKPTCDTEDIQGCPAEEIVNTYDNTIVYTDYILSSLIDILKKFPSMETGMIYASDHGESLGENNVYLHGFPYKVAPKEQKEIPMILWMSETMKKRDYVDYDCMRKEAQKNSYSHDNLFHSILGLLEVKSSLYNSEYDMFKDCRTKPLPF